jgi:hypothetical protein
VSTSVSSRTPDSASTAKRSRLIKRAVTLSATVLLIAVLFILISTQGYVSGEEFSPTHFQLRNFSFYEIPLIHIQITPIKRSGSTPSTATYVRQSALITPHKGVPTTWHLVSISRGVSTTPADANLLLDQLKLAKGDDGYWRKWSIDHPARASVFWPVIQKLAERELYIMVPQLFELAQNDQRPQELRQRMDEILIEQYVGLIRDMETADRPELAQQLLAEAEKDYPDHPELQTLRQNTSSP